MTIATTRLAIIALLLTILPACAGTTPREAPTQAQPDSETAATAADTEAGIGAQRDTAGTEILLAEQPQGWLGSDATESPGLDIVSYVPADDDPADWDQKVSFERIGGEPLDPIDLLTTLAQDQAQTCEHFSAFNTFSGLENGYATSVRLFSCGRNRLNDRGQVTMIKAIAGNEKTYVILRARRMFAFGPDDDPISAEEVASWSLYMRAIGVCDLAREEHPCPLPEATE
ncbi:MAG: hypothetical protein NXH85_01115 [Pseudomonadaceae bacterium]|nr:hypothetical protein [Pseudomonadaceae bacterium]